MTDMARLRPQGALRCQRKLTGGRAIGKNKGTIKNRRGVFVITAAVCCALRILGRAENASVPRQPAMCESQSLCTAESFVFVR